MTGIVLCGGKSSRMGRDKGLLETAGSNWAKLAFDKLAALNIPVKVSVNTNQYAEYTKIFPAETLVQDNESLQVKGPLAGVLSCHLLFPDEDLFVLACDMPLMKVSLMQQLYLLYKEPSPHTAFIFTNDNEPEPLCGIYKSTGLFSIASLLQSNRLTKSSMKFALDQLQVNSVEADTEQKKYFNNFNAHADLNGL